MLYHKIFEKMLYKYYNPNFRKEMKYFKNKKL